MPGARTQSPGFASPQQAAEAALLAPDGVSVRFTVTRCGSPDAAKVASRRFQVGFCALRARARRKSMVALKQQHTRDTDARGMYDRIVCNRTPLGDDGSWVVDLIPVSVDVASLDIIDRATGEPISYIGASQDEAIKLGAKYLASIAVYGHKGPPLTRWEYWRLKELVPDWFEEYTEGDPGAPAMDGSGPHPLDDGSNPNGPLSAAEKLALALKPKDLAEASDEELGGF